VELTKNLAVAFVGIGLFRQRLNSPPPRKIETPPPPHAQFSKELIVVPSANVSVQACTQTPVGVPFGHVSAVHAPHDFPSCGAMTFRSPNLIRIGARQICIFELSSEASAVKPGILAAGISPPIGQAIDRSSVISPCAFPYRLINPDSTYRVKTAQRFIVAARRSHPPQGFIPIAYVTRFTTSPNPTSSSVMKPGSLTLRGLGSVSSFAVGNSSIIEHLSF
jgi:hypothetical protein